MKKKIKFILILLAIAIVIELGAIIAIQAHKIFTETMQQNTTEEAKGQTKTKNKKKKIPLLHLIFQNPQGLNRDL